MEHADCKRKTAAFLVCPQCRKYGIPSQEGKSTHTCESCGYVLKCSYCGANHSLVLLLRSPAKSIECSACGTRFWEEIFEKPPKKSKRRAKVESCAYCGGEDSGCPYCKEPPCPKCKRRDAVTNLGEFFHCSACQTEFLAPSPELPVNRLTVPSKPKLIIDPDEIHKLSTKLLHRCPVCKKTNITPTLDGIRCNDCKSEWYPNVGGADIMGKDPLGLLMDRFWEETCPKCKRSGTIIRMRNGDHTTGTTGELQCCACSFRWRRIRKSKSNETPIRTGNSKPQDNSKRFTTLCSVCKRGFIEDGRCLSCGGKAIVCEVCHNPFTDKTQTSGRCENCRSSEGVFECPSCHHREPISEADVYVRCGRCENDYPASVPTVPDSRYPSDDDDEDDVVINPNEASFLRYQEKEEDIEGIVDEVLSLTHQIADTLNEQKDPADDVTDLESAIERLGELQRYIKEGRDDDDPSDNDDLWSDEEDQTEQERARWAEFDRLHGNHRGKNKVTYEGDYNEVSIVDAGDELLAQEMFDYHDGDASCSILLGCPRCKGELNEDGYCTNCVALLDRN